MYAEERNGKYVAVEGGKGGRGAEETAYSDREEDREISASFRQLLLILNKTRRRILPLENAKL